MGFIRLVIEVLDALMVIFIFNNLLGNLDIG